MIGYVLSGWLTSAVILGAFCQYYKVRAEAMAEEVINAHDWIDEIIQALEDPDVDKGDHRIVDLLGVRSDVSGAGDPA